MKKSIFVCMLLCLVFSVQEAFAANQYTWQCVDEVCSFSASSAANVASYDWKFGDGNYGSGQSVVHSYNFPGSGTFTTRVTLSYHFTNGTYQNVRCYIQLYEPGVGGLPGPEVKGGTCVGFN